MNHLFSPLAISMLCIGVFLIVGSIGAQRQIDEEKREGKK
ncbi:hypothetical protein P608_10220 [Comamonas thiooxydans]|uniref:Uncharacterized protein n=2 Tax=Comamonas TaxID=283 RepID=A0A096HPJ8_COMTE|nr:hypothetical protein P608_10220 [Comamonas thiooxydans]KGH13806.1 hypothetical protein P607_24020 [Comamonas thiooxydans]KGH30902.1 hypothetical protein P353_08550 [Comamonas testosteroni]